MRDDEYSYVDRSKATPRVRWTNRATGKEHSYTCANPREADVLGRYIAQWEGYVDRKSHVFKTGAWRNGFPNPDSAPMAETFGEYARGRLRERFERKRITERSHTIRLTELERWRIPLKVGPSLYDTPLTDLVDAKRIMERFEAAICTAQWAPGKIYSPNTVQQTINFAIGMIRRAGDEKLAPTDALGDYKAPLARRRQAARAIEFSDYLGLRKHEDGDVRLMIDVIAGTGCRIGELLGLRAEDIIVTASVCMIRFMEQEYRDKSRKPLKSTRYQRPDATPYRDVRIARWLGNDLMTFIRVNNRSGSLFRSPRPERSHQTWSHEGFEARFKRAARAAMNAGDMPLWADRTYIPTPHNLRHSYVSWALGNRLSPETIAKRTGHSSATLLNTYAESLSESEDGMDQHLESLNPALVTVVTAGACCAHCGLPAVA